MKRKFIKSILALSFILFSIILLMSCSKKDNTLKLKDEANNEYIVEKTDDEAEVKKVISSMSKLNINYPKKAELKMVYDGGINITTDNYYLDFYDSEFKLNFGLDLSKVNKDNNKIDENFEFYFDLDSEFYLNLMNYSTSESFQKQLISLPLKIQTKNDGDFVFINIGNDFYLSTTLLDYFLSDLIKNISAYQSFLKNSKTAILKSKALEEINNSSLLDKVENVTTYNTGYGIFSSLINMHFS